MKLIAALCVSAMMAFGGFGDPAKEPKYIWVYDCAPESLDGRLISQWGDPRSPAEQAIVYVSAQAQPCRPLVENEIVAVAVYGPGFATGYPVEWRTAGGNEFGVRLDINRSLPIEAACLLQSNTVRLDCYSVVRSPRDLPMSCTARDSSGLCPL